MHLGSRLIPVHTGNTPSGCIQTWCSSAHPRAYGEYRPIIERSAAPSGSSPCIRGIRNEISECVENGRLIPVHTGNTLFDPLLDLIQPAHPRAYGEYWLRYVALAPACGSSPCIRGIRVEEVTHKGITRLIPVHTGNTPPQKKPRRFLTAHPRAYGEYA